MRTMRFLNRKLRIMNKKISKKLLRMKKKEKRVKKVSHQNRTRKPELRSLRSLKLNKIVTHLKKYINKARAYSNQK